ncbi:MAG: MTAP family purine nucleoside phosphorylase [Bacteroidales bacterium]|nr:MTAP family purine nucleoside phosphorylase [Bacteroidales bacterium]
MKKLAIIGGKGFENPENFLDNFKKLKAETPFGVTNSDFYSGFFNNKEVIVLIRHGINHNIPSFKINYKANIFALRQLGISHIIATSICGSLQEEICPGEIVAIDQFIDQSKHTNLSYFDDLDENELCHDPLVFPFSQELRDLFIEAAVKKGITTHTKGVVVTVDGPRHTTRAESNLYRSWKADIVNMTTAPEAILANELKIEYAVVSLCTNYEAWRTDIKPATKQEKDEIIAGNKSAITDLIKEAISKF